jgi:hypothetical protein
MKTKYYVINVTGWNKMKWTEVDGPGPIKPDDFFNFPYEYWMDVTDPRGKYLSEYEDFIMSGGGWY